MLYACNNPIAVPAELQMLAHPRPSHAVCPALWELLPLLAATSWGTQAGLRLAAAAAPALHTTLAARPSHTVLTVVPSRVSGGNFAAARSRQEYTQGHQLAAQLQAALLQLLGGILMSPEPLRALLLSPGPPASADDAPAAAALTDLLALQCSMNSALRDAAHQALCSVGAADSGQPLSASLTLLLQSPHTATALIEAVSSQLQGTCGATVQQLCSAAAPAIATLELCAALCSAGAEAREPQLAGVADTGWDTALHMLATCVNDLRAAGGASYGTLYPRELDAVLTAAVRTLAVLWVAHKHVAVTEDSTPGEAQAGLAFLEPFLAVRTVRPRITADLAEVWEAGLMAVTGELPAPAPWGGEVEAAAVQVVQAEGVAEAVKDHLSHLLGSAAPDRVAQVRVTNAIKDLPRKNIIDLTTPTKPPTAGGRTLAAALRTPERKAGSNSKGVSTSPLLSAWQRAQARMEKAPAVEHPQAEVGVVPIKAQGVQPLAFSRTGGAQHAKDAAPAPKQTRVPVATLYERAGLKQPPAPRRAAAAAAEARAGVHTHPPAAAGVAAVSRGPAAGSLVAPARPPRSVVPAAASKQQRRPRLRDIVNGTVDSDSDGDKAKGSDEEDMPLYKRRKPRERPPPPISHGGVSRTVGSRAAGGARGVAAARPPPPRPVKPPPQPPPPPAPPPPVLSTQLIEKTAQALKAANESSKKIRLAPLPTFGGRAAGARAAAVAAKPAAPKTDLTHSSSEKSFTQQLLSSDVQEFTRYFLSLFFSCAEVVKHANRPQYTVCLGHASEALSLQL